MFLILVYKYILKCLRDPFNYTSKTSLNVFFFDKKPTLIVVLKYVCIIFNHFVFISLNISIEFFERMKLYIFISTIYNFYYFRV